MQVKTPPRGDASLLVLLLAELFERVPDPLSSPVGFLGGFLGGALAPVVSVQGGTSKASVRFKDDGAHLENGLADDAWVHVSGDVEAMLGAATMTDPLRYLLSGRIRVVPRPIGVLRGRR